MGKVLFTIVGDRPDADGVVIGVRIVFVLSTLLNQLPHQLIGVIGLHFIEGIDRSFPHGTAIVMYMGGFAMGEMSDGYGDVRHGLSFLSVPLGTMIYYHTFKEIAIGTFRCNTSKKSKMKLPPVGGTCGR